MSESPDWPTLRYNPRAWSPKDRPIAVEKVFSDPGSHAAEAWCKAQGLSVGTMAAHLPRGIVGKLLAQRAGSIDTIAKKYKHSPGCLGAPLARHWTARRNYFAIGCRSTAQGCRPMTTAAS